jgi:dTMP kinase
VFLDLEPWQAEQRGGYGEEKYEKREFQSRVRQFYLLLMGRLLEGESAKTARVINAGDSMDVVEERVWKEVLPWVEMVEGGSCGDKVGTFQG